MKNLILIICVYLAIVSINSCKDETAQELAGTSKTFPLLSDNPVWTVCYNMDTYPTSWKYDSIRYEKDTLIGNKQYFKFSSISYPAYEYGFVRVSGTKVYLYKSGKDYLMYDFSLNVGDVVTCGYYVPRTTEMKVIGVDTVNYNDFKYKRLTLELNPSGHHPMTTEWIEGVGSNVYPFYSLEHFYDTGGWVRLISLNKNYVRVFRSSFDTTTYSLKSIITNKIPQ